MYYNPSEFDANNLLGIFMIIYVLILGLGLISAIVNYLLRGFGMYKMGRAKGKDHAWMAFIPFARTYFQGELGGEITFKKKTMRNPGMWLLIIPIIGNVIVAMMYFAFLFVSAFQSMNSYVYDVYETSAFVSGTISSLIVFVIMIVVFSVLYHGLLKVLYILVNRQIYMRYTTDTMALVHAVLGTIIPFYESACLFIFGRKAEEDLDENHPDEGEDVHQEIELPQICE